MKKSTIHFEVELDDQHIPEKISWNATGSPQGDSLKESKSVSIAVWDHEKKHTLRLDLWAKDMPVEEMKKFYIECLAGIGDSIQRSINDKKMSDEVHALCEKLTEIAKNS